jgi:hypothetical protein
VAIVAVAMAAAAAWVFVSHPLEGPVLLTLSRDHGVHATDVLAAIPLVWAWRQVRRH